MAINLATDDHIDPMSDPDSRQEIEAARAANKAQATEALRREVQRHASQLLPGAIDRIVEKEGRKLGGGSPADVARKVFEYLQTPAADFYRKPETAPVRAKAEVDFNIDGGGSPAVRPSATAKPAEPKADALRQALALFAGDFKTPALMEKFYQEHALEWAWAEPSAAVEFVAGAMADRKFKAYQKNPAPLSPATLRLVEALTPFDAMIAGRLEDVAESEHFADLVGPNSPTSVKDLMRLVESRLKKSRSCASLLINGEFEPEKVVRPRPVVQAQAEQPAQPSAPLTPEEANRRHFASLRW